MLKELSNKGGKSDASNVRNFRYKIDASALKSKVANKDTDDDQITMYIQQIIPPGGYLPVTLVSRGDSLMERSYQSNKRVIKGMAKKTRPLNQRPMINPKLDRASDEMFDQIRKRQKLTDNEQVAYAQLKMAVGIRSKGPYQVPMADDYGTKVYN